MPRSLGRVLAALAVLGLIGAGCSNNPYPPGETAKPTSFRAFVGTLRTLDPSTSYVQDEGYVVDVIYSSYFKYHPFKMHPYELVLNLGAQEPTREKYTYTAVENGKPVQRTGEVWTFRIKKGLRFQDDPAFPGGKGREITAADFLYSFRRMADPTLTPPSPVLAFFQDKIVGMDEYVKENLRRKAAGQKMDLQHGVSGLELDPTDPYTFRIRLNQPYPQLRYLMAMHFTTPIPHEAVEKYGGDLRTHPVGSGPYQLKEYSIGRRIVLVKNPNRNPEFYPTDGEPGDREAGLLADAGKQLPLTDEVVFSFQREAITAWNLFLQGYLDNWGVTQTNLRQVITQQGELSPEMKRKGIQLRESDYPNTWYFAFNMEDPVYGGYTPQRRKLRQAVSLAIDGQAYIDLFNMGVGKVAQSVVPPGLFGYEESYRNPYRQANIARAKQLLAEAGYPGGIDPKTGQRLTLYYDYIEAGAAQRQFAGLLQKQVESIGIKLEPRAERDVVWQDLIDQGKFQFMYYGWIADYPDPENFDFLLYGPNKRPGVNESGYDSPEYNQLFEQMRSMDDSPERLAIIRRMRELAQEDMPMITVYHGADLLLNYSWLKNVKPNGVPNDLAKYRRVDGAQRVALQKAWNQPNYWPSIALLVFLVAGSVPAAQVVRRHRRRRVRRN